MPKNKRKQGRPSRKGKSRNWGGVVVEPQHPDKYYAQLFTSKLIDNGGCVRCFRFQREVGKTSEKEHLQIALVFKNTCTALAASKKKLLGDIIISYTLWDTVQSLFKYVSKVDDGTNGGRKAGHEVLEGV